MPSPPLRAHQLSATPRLPRFANMMKTLMFPHNRHRVACVGKGGTAGGQYMMERARQMLMAQGHSGNPSHIVMVGDRYDTDVRAGLAAGFQTCLVLTGCHTLGCQQYYRAETAHQYAHSIQGLIPTAKQAAAAAAAATAAPAAAANESLHRSRSSRASKEAGAQELLQDWVLQQSSLLCAGSADQARGALRPTLRTFFDLIDEDGSGTIDEDELLRACTTLGLLLGSSEEEVAVGRSSDSGVREDGAPTAELAPRSKAQMPPRLAAMFGPQATSMLAVLRARLRARVHQQQHSALPEAGAAATASSAAAAEEEDAGLTFEEFAVAIEEALAECGVEARRQWKTAGRRLSILRQATKVFKVGGSAAGSSSQRPA